MKKGERYYNLTYHLFSLTNCYGERICFAVKGATSIAHAKRILSHLKVTFRGKTNNITAYNADVWTG